jgi:hypothetical protein
MSTKTRATIDDLYKVEGKAELVNGEIVEMPLQAQSEIATEERKHSRHLLEIDLILKFEERFEHAKHRK